MKTAFIAAAGLCLGSTVHAVVSTNCPESDICYQLNIPDTTASSGTGDIYFQLSAPTSYQWVSLGQGTSMSGSNIFVMYTSADGTNVTVSPRLGTGNRQPDHNAAAQIAVLAGSGVANGVMTANVRCSSCGSWSGGSMDFTGSSSKWIHAYKTGSALNSDDPGANIDQHNNAKSFSWDLTQARGGADVDPFVSSATNTTDPVSNTPVSSNPGSPSDTAGPAGSGSSSRSQSQQDRMNTAHAICAALVFVALFPLGAILICVASFTGLVWVHVAIQSAALTIYIAAVGLGLYIAIDGGKLNAAHPIIGLVLFGVLFFQPLLGWMHHRLYKKYGGRTLWSHAHLTVGRVAIVLGIVNGGLGLQLADAEKSAVVAYGVVAGVVGLVYLAAIGFGEAKRKRSVGRDGRGEKDGMRLHDLSSGSSRERVVDGSRNA